MSDDGCEREATARLQTYVPFMIPDRVLLVWRARVVVNRGMNLAKLEGCS